jgi:hypothetical protein
MVNTYLSVLQTTETLMNSGFVFVSCYLDGSVLAKRPYTGKITIKFYITVFSYYIFFKSTNKRY